jgi:hypothetical protein
MKLLIEDDSTAVEERRRKETRGDSATPGTI